MKSLLNAPDASSSGIYEPADLAAFVKAVLAEGHAYPPEKRRQSTRRLIDVLKEYIANPSGCGVELATAAVSALKTLGRSADGTEDLASEEGIDLLLRLAQFSSDGLNDSFMRDPMPQASSEAVRCLANVCLLHEPARVRLAGVSKLPAALLSSEEQAKDPTTRFLCSRLLFLVTISGGEAVATLVEDLNIADYLSRRLLNMLDEISTPSSKPPPMLAEILTEYLKVAFNVSLFYPRVARDPKPTGGDGKWAPNGENGQRQGTPTRKSASTPMSKSTSSSSTSSSKSGSRSSESDENTSLRRISLKEGTTGSHGPTSGPTATTKRRAKSPSNLPKAATDKIKGYFSRNKGKQADKVSNMYQDDADVLRPWGFEEVVNALVQFALCLPFGKGAENGPFGIYKHVINGLLNYNLTSYTNTVFAPLEPASAPSIPDLPSTSPNKAAPSLPPLVARLLTLLDGCLAFYIPGASGPDDNDAREAALSCPGVLDESLQVLLLLLTKCAVEDANGDVRRGLKQCLLADDIDRTIGLEKRKDLTGRLIRLMNSTYLSGSGDSASKFLFAICEQDPSKLVAAIGYGNASGFLQSMNMLIPPGATATPQETVNEGSTDNARTPSPSPPRAVNPITGAYEQPSSSNEPAMTDEEKEREAEKLFVLFDRMNRNGAMSVVNPVKEAQASGKLMTTAEEEEEERKRLEQEEEENERQALAEMQRYKERKNRPAQ